jgi:RNA polymerase sigma-70 factor (ECF subfamily)
MDQDEEILPGLLAQSVDGHFHLVVKQYENQLLATTLKRTRNKDDAQDVVQETFMRSYHAFSHYPPLLLAQLNIRAWLSKTALRCFLNTRRRQTYGIKIEILQEDQLEDLEDTSQVLPEQALESSEHRQWLLSVLAGLPKYGEELFLLYFEELTCQEIAHYLGKPVGTVKSNLARGRHLLRVALETRKEEME